MIGHAKEKNGLYYLEGLGIIYPRHSSLRLSLTKQTNKKFISIMSFMTSFFVFKIIFSVIAQRY